MFNEQNYETHFDGQVQNMELRLVSQGSSSLGSVSLTITFLLSFLVPFEDSQINFATHGNIYSKCHYSQENYSLSP